LRFASLRELNRQRFISPMNEFLIASSKYRRQMIEQWERDYEQPIDSNLA
jgi:hypothetical protein